ncbi:hypothetical protein GWK16_06350 [Roseomonas sp. JC162]|uniref:Uncharacterized protein n=1 Tax=Neoroseomonas marina TaxID=1232220 RepID=A0A848E8S3_9PROT|nr:hypothetical protein [Neoroseomonas marina]NMJ40854.1 hypothetical protein [Neoroseomonas marina]
MAAPVDTEPHGVAARAIQGASALVAPAAWVVGRTMEAFPRGGGRDLATQVHDSLAS